MTVSWRTVSQDKMAEEDKSLPEFQHNQVTTLTIHNDDLYKNLDFLNPDEKNHKHVEVKDDFNLPVSLAILLVLIYMIVGGLLFSLWEKWTFFEAFYFVFISMTTIGFGDYVPQHEKYMLGAFAYLLLGLMLTSMCINVIREKITVTFQKARVRIGSNTVLNVGALLQDEDHRSRAPQIYQFDSQQNRKCYGYKMTPHKDSVATNIPQIVTTDTNGQVSIPRELTVDNLGAENMLKLPSQNRFTFYDSPYNTIQDENESSPPSLLNRE